MIITSAPVSSGPVVVTRPIRPIPATAALMVAAQNTRRARSDSLPQKAVEPSTETADASGKIAAAWLAAAWERPSDCRGSKI